MRAAFYRVHTDLTPVIDDVARQLQNGARALLLIHYFGFHRNAEPYRRLCDQYGAVLIEDCAHTFFGLTGQSLPGELGHYAIASTRKLFPLPDGGAAISEMRDLEQSVLKAVSWTEEGRRVAQTLQRAANAERLGFLSRPVSGIMHFIDKLRGTSGNRPVLKSASTTTNADDAAGVVVPKGKSRVAICLMNATDTQRLVSIRRRNYTTLLLGTQSIQGCQALFPDLPMGVVPYVFPLILGDPAHMFPTLKLRQVPIYRWEGIGGLGCPVADAYESQLIQLPCHQELTARDIEWILDQLRQLAGPPA